MTPYSLADDLEDTALRDETYGPRRVQPRSAVTPPSFVYRMTLSGDGREYSLAEYYAHGGGGLPLDMREARQLVSIAARAGDERAIKRLAELR